MKLSCTPISYRRSFAAGEMDLPHFIESCAAMGCQAVDLLSTQHYPWLWQDPARELPRVQGWLRDAGLALAAHGCGNNFTHADPLVRQQEVQKVHAAIIEAAELGAPVLRLFGGHIEPERRQAGMGSHIGLPLVIEGIEQCITMAQRHGVTLALENHSNMPGHSYEVAAVIEYFNTPTLRCLFDMANFMGHSMDEVEDPLRALDRLLPYVVHVHVKDVGPAEFFKERTVEAYVTGRGKVPVRQVIARLESCGYAGFYSLEYEAAFKVPESQGVAESFAYMKNIAQLHRALRMQPAARD